MHILRRLGAVLCAFILVFSLWSLVWSTLFVTTVRNREVVKGWVNESGFYTNIVDVVLDSAKSDSDPNSTDIPVNDPQVQTVAKAALSSDFLKQTVEKALDDTYNWLGSDQNLKFTIDLTEAKQKLINGLGDYAATKAASLPVCATNESASDFDAFTAVCIPRGLSAAAAGQQVKDQLASNQEFIKDPVIDTSDIKLKNEQGQEVTLEEAIPSDAIKNTYRSTGYAPVVLAITALLSIAGIIFLSISKIAGMRRVGYIFASAGALLGALYGTVYMIVDVIHEAAANADRPQAFRDLINNGADAVSSDVKRVILAYTLAYLLIAAILITIGIVKRQRKVEDETKDPAPVKEPAPKAVEAPKKPAATTKKPPKIQL